MDARDLILLGAIKANPGMSLPDLWHRTSLHTKGEGYGRAGERGRFNYGYCERACTRLRKAGVITNNKGWTLTPEGEGQLEDV